MNNIKTERSHNIRRMMYQVDAFTDRLFSGNPAAVVPLASWLDDELMQFIAAENNLSETAFFVATEQGFHLRWFTPSAEVALCGHATLATAHVIFNHLGYTGNIIRFETLGGELRVEKRQGLLCMDFPATPPSPCHTPATMAEALGKEPVEVLAADDYLVRLESKADVLAIEPDDALLSQLDLRGVIVTAPANRNENTSESGVDFVSRFFAPNIGIHEDPVTGSAHCTLTPYWAAKLGKRVLHARQISKRGGDIICELKGDRISLSGHAITFMQAEIWIS